MNDRGETGMITEGGYLTALRRFHERNWREDAGDLDGSLARRAQGTAGLAATPPSIITGDPFSLEADSCVLVLGINPRWPGSRLQKLDAEPAAEAWKKGFDHYREHRRGYFDEAEGPAGRTKNADARYNGPHFSRLGNAIAGALACADADWKPGAVARQFFRSTGAILDLIPYWSTNAANLDLGRADLERDSCLVAWRAVVQAFITEKRPRLILVNNTGQPTLVENFVGCEIKPLGGGFFGGKAGTTGPSVLCHRFLGAWRGITRDAYIRRFREAANKLQIDVQSIGADLASASIEP
jgi:hypothetical protein